MGKLHNTPSGLRPNTKCGGGGEAVILLFQVPIIVDVEFVAIGRLDVGELIGDWDEKHLGEDLISGGVSEEVEVRDSTENERLGKEEEDRRSREGGGIWTEFLVQVR
ncbi:hypothetical protein PS2_003758 [Malus domestica]